jgi:hypothetical protein
MRYATETPIQAVADVVTQLASVAQNANYKHASLDSTIRKHAAHANAAGEDQIKIYVRG